ncbi:MAG TPA: cell envelope integrity protein TolA [Steroidobacteraceae bacterium]|jgi:colicin import membrane protein|nr:cell envelope integrity protein TolA [Steroidobacteraceae bacterium]
MPGFFQEHLRPLAGSTGLHVVLVALLVGAAVQWRSEQPPVELAIEGYVADLPPDKSTPRARATPPAPAPKPVEAAPKPPEPAVEPPPERRAEAAAAAERAAQAEKAAQAEREKRQADERAREQAAADQARAEEAERKRAAEVETKRKAAEEESRRKVEAAEAKRKAAEQAQADREAKARAEREAELQRSLAAEEESAALARSGVMDEYRSLLVQTIERSWIRPPSARAGLECTLYVTQAPGGTVIDVKLGPCNGDQATRESITNAVFRASPLPAPRDPRAFERRLEIVFKPTE